MPASLYAEGAGCSKQLEQSCGLESCPGSLKISVGCCPSLGNVRTISFFCDWVCRFQLELSPLSGRYVRVV